MADTSDWRTQVTDEVRRKVADKLYGKFRECAPSLNTEQHRNYFRIMAAAYELKSYNAATSTQDYLRRICYKLFGTLEQRVQSFLNSLQQRSQPVNQLGQITQTSGERIMTEPETSDWRTQLKPEDRGQVIDKLFLEFRACVPVLDDERHPNYLRNMAATYEEKSYKAATSMQHYHEKIGCKLETIGSNLQSFVNGLQQRSQPENQAVSGMAPENTGQNILGQSQHQLKQSGETETQSDAFNTSDTQIGNQSRPSPIERIVRALQSLPSEMLRDTVTDMWKATHGADAANHTLQTATPTEAQSDGNNTAETSISPVECALEELQSMSPTTFSLWCTDMWPLRCSEALVRKKPEFINTASSDVELESDAATGIKRPNVSNKCALLEEVKEINQRQMETVAEIIEEGVNQSTIVKLTFTPVGSRNKQYTWTERLLIPEDYPHCLPKFVDNLSVDETCELSADLSLRTRSSFSRFLGTLSQPTSLKDMIKAWNDCAHDAFGDYATRNGGGTAFET